jgi:hypothetical protein
VHGHEADLMRFWQSLRSKAKYLPLAVPVFGLAELGAHLFFARRAPSEKQWSEVRSLVAAWYKPGDVVVVAPYWAEPMARWKFGDELMPVRDVARPDTTRYAEAIEVSTLGQRAPELAGWKVIREAKHDAFTIRALANPSPPAVTYVFGDHVGPDAMEASTEKGGVKVSCPFNPTSPIEGGGLGGPPIYPAARFACPGEPSHVFVGTTIIDDELAHPRRCIWASSPTGQGETVAHFRDVPLGTKIRGHAGMGWLIERDRAVPAFTIRVLVRGAEVGRVVHEPGDFWKEFEVPLGAAAGTTADVEFRVSSPGGMHACFEADSR